MAEASFFAPGTQSQGKILGAKFLPSQGWGCHGSQELTWDHMGSSCCALSIVWALLQEDLCITA